MWFGNRKVKPSGSEFATLILKLIGKAYPWDILSTAGLVEVHIDPLQLEVAGSLVHTAGVHAVLIADDLPELEKTWFSMVTNCNCYHWSTQLPSVTALGLTN